MVRMSPDAPTPPWILPGWIDGAKAWIHGELERLGRAVDGPIEQTHLRPWSTVLTVPTRGGTVFFKASAGDLTHETAVTQALARWLPGDLPEVLAADSERGWMLMANGGTRFREVLAAEQDLGRWEAALPRYAELQMVVAEHLDELLALGIPDRRLAVLPSRFVEVLDETEAHMIGHPDGLTTAEYRRLLELAPLHAERCQRLAAFGIPESIHHGDLHDGNIFLQDGRYLFFDWGDASAAHPFFSLRTAFVSLENTLGLAEDAPEFDRLRDAYLEPWTRVGSPPELLEAFDLARRLSPFASALGWRRAVARLEDRQRDDYAHAVPSLLQEYLENAT